MASDIEERIRARAHAIWEEEGRPDGRAEEHWARATREVEAGIAAETAETTDAPPARKPSARKPAGKKAEPAPDATPARKSAAPRKPAATEKASKAEAAAEPAPRKPRARKTQTA